MLEEQNQVHAEKSRQRKSARTRRNAFTAPERRRACEQIYQACYAHLVIAKAQTIFICISTPEEVDTRKLIDTFASRGVTTLVPFVSDSDTMAATCFSGRQSMRPGMLNILSPPLGAPYIDPVTIALVPRLAFTAHGARLGYGGGYYDRWLTEHPHTTSICLAFHTQMVPQLPICPTDISMTSIITDSQSIVCRDPA